MVKQIISGILILFLVGVVLISGCSDSKPTPTQVSQNEEATVATVASMPISTQTEEVITKFDLFEKGLNSANIHYQSTEMGADLIGAEEGRKYKFDEEKVELYRFDEDSDEFQDVIQHKAVTLEGFGSFPVEVNGNMVLMIEDTKNKDIILEIFYGLK